MAGIRADRCPETGQPHRFTQDLEYDATGETINCEDCGELAPEGFELDDLGDAWGGDEDNENEVSFDFDVFDGIENVRNVMPLDRDFAVGQSVQIYDEATQETCDGVVVHVDAPVGLLRVRYSVSLTVADRDNPDGRVTTNDFEFTYEYDGESFMYQDEPNSGPFYISPVPTAEA